MIKFGPSGCCQEFAKQGHSHTIEAAEWLANLGLDCFEYSFGRGVQVKVDTARAIGQEFAKNNIEISVHAPYFINLATLEEEKATNNIRYITDSLIMLREFGGKRCVFHPGSPLKADRKDAVKVMMSSFENILKIKQQLGLNDLILCPETMGKKAQLGDLDEIIELCKLGGDDVVPCIDWGHLNSRDCGVFFAKDDYKRAIDKLLNGLGEEKTSKMHVHFSKIEFTKNGELRHLTFEDSLFGPPFEPLLEVYKEYALQPYIVCESAGTQTLDALAMKNYFNNL
ncbi:MAG: TIM barrel protein [Clostridia bacterium]